MHHVTYPSTISKLMPPSPSNTSSASSTSASSSASFHGLPASSTSSTALLSGGSVEEADDTDEDWEESASYFPSTTSLPSFSSLPLPSLSSLPATLSSASSSLSSLLTALPALSSISESDLRQLQSTVQSLLSDSLENVVHHAKLFARVGGDWWLGREREKDRHSKLTRQRRRHKGQSTRQRTPRGEDAEMAEYVMFLTQLVQATGSEWEAVREERDEAAVMSGQRLTVVREHFGQWDERERRMVDRIREELKAAKRKELELAAAAENAAQLRNEEEDSPNERVEREPEAQHEQRPSRQHPASDASALSSAVPTRLARTGHRQRIPADSVSPSADASDPHAQQPLSSPTFSTDDVAAAARRPSSSSATRQFDQSAYRPPRMITPIPTISPHSPWLSQAVQSAQSLTSLTTATTRTAEASGYWNNHTQLFIPSSQHAALVSHGAPAAPPLYLPSILSRPHSRSSSSVVSPAVTLPFTPLAAVVASLVSGDGTPAPITSSLVVEESLLPAASSPPDSAVTVPSPNPSTTAAIAMVQGVAQHAPSAHLAASDTPSALQAHLVPPHTLPPSSPAVKVSVSNSEGASVEVTRALAVSSPSTPPTTAPLAINELKLTPPTTAVPPTPLAPSPPALSVDCAADAPPAPPMSDVPAAPPKDDVPFAPPFDSLVPPPPPMSMSTPTSPAAALPPPLALSSGLSSPTKRCSMKRLHWSKLRYENVAQSVWSQLLQSTPGASDGQQQDELVVDVEAMKQLIDVSELEDKFTTAGNSNKEASTRDGAHTRPAAKADQRASGSGEVGKTQAEDERRDNSTAVNSTRAKMSQFTAVDTLRAYNVEIAFSQLKMSADSIKQALLLEGWKMDQAGIGAYLQCVQQLVTPLADAAADSSSSATTLPASPLSDCPLSADQLDILSRIVPTDEEAARTLAAPPSATPGIVEQFFRAMCSIPRVRRRVELLAFVSSAPAEVDEAEEVLDGEGGMSLDMVEGLSLIHISEPTRPY